jgi:hypothetical protein
MCLQKKKKKKKNRDEKAKIGARSGREILYHMSAKRKKLRILRGKSSRKVTIQD